MKLYYSMLADELQYYNARHDFSLLNDPSVEDVRIFIPGQKHNDLYLYVITSNQFMGCEEDLLPTNLLLLGEASSEYEARGHHLFQINTKMDPIEALALLQDIFADYRGWYDRMNEAIINQSSIEKVMDIAAEKLKNPIALFDNTNSLIHWSGSMPPDITNTVWESVIKHGTSMDFYSPNETKKIFEYVKRSDLPYYKEVEAGSRHSIVSCLLEKDGGVFAALGSTAINVPFTNGQLRLISILKKVLEKALSKFASHVNEMKTVPYYLEYLLSGMTVDTQRVNHYLRHVGWKADDSFLLLNFCYPVKLLEVEFFSHTYIKKIEEILPESLSCLYGESIVVIINTSKQKIDMSGLEQKIEKYYKTYHLQCGISLEFYSFMDLKVYYQQSVLSIEEGHRVNPELPYYHFIDYYEPSLFHLLESNLNLKVFCHPKILKNIKKNDNSHNYLVETLLAYLVNGKNASATSAALYIHRNTLNYRLEKIAELLNIEFETIDPSTQFFLLISCKIADYI